MLLNLQPVLIVSNLVPECWFTFKNLACFLSFGVICLFNEVGDTTVIQAVLNPNLELMENILSLNTYRLYIYKSVADSQKVFRKPSAQNVPKIDALEDSHQILTFQLFTVLLKCLLRPWCMLISYDIIYSLFAHSQRVHVTHQHSAQRHRDQVSSC